MDLPLVPAIGPDGIRGITETSRKGRVFAVEIVGPIKVEEVRDVIPFGRITPIDSESQIINFCNYSASLG